MKRIKTKNIEDSNVFSEVGHKHADPVAIFHYVHAIKSIVYVTTRLAKASINKQNTASWAFQRAEKNQWVFVVATL